MVKASRVLFASVMMSDQSTPRSRAVTPRQGMGSGPDLLGLYLDEAGSFPLLTKADEMRLGQIIQEGQAAQVRLDSDEKLTAKMRRDLRKQVDAAEEATTEFI